MFQTTIIISATIAMITDIIAATITSISAATITHIQPTPPPDNPFMHPDWGKWRERERKKPMDLRCLGPN